MKNRIIQMRKVWRLTPENVANMTGINLSDYKSYETGTKEPSMNDAMALCDVFKISLDYLMRGIISDKDKKAINRPLTKEEQISDKLEELQKLYSPGVYKKWEKELYAIYIDRSKGHYLGDEYGHISNVRVMECDDFEFFKELCNNGKVEIYTPFDHHKKVSSYEEALNYDILFNLIQRDSIKDKTFISLMIKHEPTKILNYYYLLKEEYMDYERILDCLNAGGYVEKVVNINYYYDDEEGTTSKTYEFGRDTLATMLLREYCLNKISK